MFFDKLSAIFLDFKWLGLWISDPVWNLDRLQPNLFLTIQYPDTSGFQIPTVSIILDPHCILIQVASFETAEKEGERLLRSCANVASVAAKNRSAESSPMTTLQKTASSRQLFSSHSSPSNSFNKYSNVVVGGKVLVVSGAIQKSVSSPTGTIQKSFCSPGKNCNKILLFLILFPQFWFLDKHFTRHYCLSWAVYNTVGIWIIN